MLPERDAFLASLQDDTIAICGLHIGNDAFHVGVFYKYGPDSFVFHYNGGNDVLLDNVHARGFSKYYFAPIKHFPHYLIPAVAALSELVEQKRFQFGFIFNRETPVYDGGKFNLHTGGLLAKSAVEKYINCAVFSLAFLKSFDNFSLVDWNSFPVPLPEFVPYLKVWLDNKGIPENERGSYYNQAKTIRGKHVLVSPLAPTSPGQYNDLEDLSAKLVGFVLQN